MSEAEKDVGLHHLSEALIHLCASLPHLHPAIRGDLLQFIARLATWLHTPSLKGPD